MPINKYGVTILDSGNYIVPARAEVGNGDDNLVIGDGTMEIGPDHLDYTAWTRYIAERDTDAGTSDHPEVDVLGESDVNSSNEHVEHGGGLSPSRFPRDD